MFDRLTEWLISWPEDRVAQFLLQDMALCRAWRSSRHGDPDYVDLNSGIEARIGLWLEARHVQDVESEGRRHQYLLRELVGKLQEDLHHEMNADEAAFLWSVYDLAGKLNNEAESARIEKLLLPHLDVLRHICVSKIPTPGLMGLEDLVDYSCEADALRAPIRETRLLAGIELPCRGPVLTVSGHLRFMGDVPDNCTIVVEGNGVCSVDGYVMGRVLAKRACEVRGNISGAAVVLDEDVRARGVVNKGFVVAKLGSVHTRSMQGPRLIYAGQDIVVKGSTMLGHMVAKNITIRDEMRGGRIEVSGEARAGKFTHLGNNTGIVVLREALSHEDFYEMSGDDLNKLLGEAGRLRREIRNFESAAESAEREAEHAARSVLMYLFGGSETQRKLEVLVSMRDRLDLIERMVRNLRVSLEDAEARLTGRSFEAGVKTGQGEILSLEIEGTPDRKLVRQREDVLRLLNSLGNTRSTRRDTAQAVERVRAKLQQLEAEQETLSAELTQKETKFQVQGGYEKLLAGTGSGASKLDVLQKVLPTLRQQRRDSSIATRLNSGFVTLALRNIERRLGHILDYQEKADDCKVNFKSVSDQLGKDFHVTVPGIDPMAAVPASVTGGFDKGVKIYLGIYVEEDYELPMDRILQSDESEQRTYTLPTASGGFHINQVG